MTIILRAFLWHMLSLLCFRPHIQAMPSGRTEAYVLIALSTLAVALSLHPVDALFHVAVLSAVLMRLDQPKLTCALAMISLPIHTLGVITALADFPIPALSYRIYEIVLWIYTVHRWRQGA